MAQKEKKVSLQTRARHYIVALSKVISRGEITQTSIIIAYYVLFSVFPIIIIVGNVLPLFKIDTKPIADYLEVIFPAQVSSFVMPIINGLLRKHSGGFISFGIIFAIWSFSGLINSIRLAMNRIYGVYNNEKKQPWWHTLFARSLSFVTTGLMVLIFALVTFVFAFGKQIMEFLAPIFHFSLDWVYQLQSYRWPVIILMMIVVIFYLDYVLPNIERKKRSIWPGVFFTTFSWSALSYFFGLYIRRFGVRWQNYGIVGSFIIFMLWLNIGALLMLFGVCMNAAKDLLRYGPAHYRASGMAAASRFRRK